MCTTCAPAVNVEKQDAFANRILGTLNQGMLAVMVSVGHRSRLFDVMSGGDARTSAAWAQAAGLQERYVREWLGAMVVGEIVERDPATNTYRLPPEHAHWLSRQSPTANLAAFAQYVPVVASVEDQVLHCFTHGGGVPYTAYGRFHDVMAEDSGQSIVPIIVDQIVPMIPGLHARLTAGIEVLDIGCGRGMALMALARAYPMSAFTGYDLSAEALQHARQSAAAAGLHNVRFIEKDLTHWDEPEAFDWITALDAIHDQARPDRVLRAIRRALRPRGVFLMQDIDTSSEPTENIRHPMGSFIYSISCMHCMTVSLAQGGMGLGAAWGVQLAERMLKEAGFEAVNIHRLPHDVQNAYFICPVSETPSSTDARQAPQPEAGESKTGALSAS